MIKKKIQMQSLNAQPWPNSVSQPKLHLWSEGLDKMSVFHNLAMGAVGKNAMMLSIQLIYGH